MTDDFIMDNVENFTFFVMEVHYILYFSVRVQLDSLVNEIVQGWQCSEKESRYC